MTLSLRANICVSFSLETQIVAFHQYTIFMNFLIENLSAEDLRKHFIKSTLFTLIHLIDSNYKNYSLLNVIACVYLKKFCNQAITLSLDVIREVLIILISTIIPIASLNNELASHCMDLLNILVVKKNTYLSEAISLLDPFPIDTKFQEIQNIYNITKYANKYFQLKDEINHFLKAGNLMKNVGCRTEGLKHLRKQLATRKEELKALYNELYKLRGFSEDCANSIIHQLICMLVKLTSCSNKEVSVTNFFTLKLKIFHFKRNFSINYFIFINLTKFSIFRFQSKLRVVWANWVLLI